MSPSSTAPIYLQFQPLLYQVAAGILPPGLIAPAIRSVLKKQDNARAVLADAHDLDLYLEGGGADPPPWPEGGAAVRHARRRGRRQSRVLRAG